MAAGESVVRESDVKISSQNGRVLTIAKSVNDNVSLLMGIRDVASRMPTPPILTWIPSHIGIEGNEAADRAARQALLKPAIDTHLPLSKARTRQTIKQTARDIYETLEQLNPSRSVSLHQHVSLSISDSKALLNMTSRSDQRAIYRFETFCAPLQPDKTHRPGCLPIL